MFKKLFKFFLGKTQGQSFFQLIFRIGLKGMNFGGGSDFRESGEEWVLKHIAKNTVNQPVAIFDIGANVGNYALLVSKIFPKASIFSFEPAKKTFLSLQENTRLVENIRCYNFGFSNSVGKTLLYSNIMESGLSSVYSRKGLGLDNQEEIQMDTIDSFCKENRILQIDFLKLDVEGNEYKVLEGAKNMLNQNKIKYIQFEFGGTDIDARVFFRDFYKLLAPQYQLFRILKNGLHPIATYQETEEIFITTNYFAELK